MTPMRISKDDHRRSVAMSELAVQINDFQNKRNLSTWEVISVLSGWIQLAMKYVIREDRRES